MARLGAAQQRRRGEEGRLRRGRIEAGEPHLQAAHALGRLQQRLEQRADPGGDGVLVGEAGAEGVAAAHGVSRPAHLHADRASGEAERLQPPRGAPGEGVRDLLEREAVAPAVADRRFLLDEGRRGGDGDRRLLLPAGGGAEAGGRGPDGAGEHAFLAVGDLADGGETGPLERRDEVRRQAEGGDGLAREEGVLVAGQDDEEAARLRPPGRDPCGEAGGGEAERGVEAEAALELVADRLRRAHRGGVVGPLHGQVDEGLVGGGALHPAARGEKDGRHLFAVAAVGVEVAPAEHGLGAGEAGLRQGQADPHPRLPRLVAGRGHEAQPAAVAADHDRPPAQGGVEAPFHRDEERVEVDVQDAAATVLHEPSVGGTRGGEGPEAARGRGP